MVLCSLEEAWGPGSFNNLNNKPTVTKTDSRYKYDFSRDSRPLSEHNGCYRVPNKHRIQVNNRGGRSKYKKEVPDHSLEDEDNEDDDMEFDNNRNKNYQNLENIYNDSSEETYQGAEEDNEYETFSNENEDNSVFIEDEDGDVDDEFQGEETKNRKDDDKNEYYDNYQTETEDNEGGVTINMSLIMDKLNKVMNMVELSSKADNNGMKDIFIFIIIGIFLIFILDLIFRIGQKMSS